MATDQVQFVLRAPEHVDPRDLRRAKRQIRANAGRILRSGDLSLTAEGPQWLPKRLLDRFDDWHCPVIIRRQPRRPMWRKAFRRAAP